MQEKIINASKEKPSTIEELSKELKLDSSSDFILLNKTVNKLIEEGKLFEHKNQIY